MGGDIVLTSVLIYILHTSRTGISKYVLLTDFGWGTGTRMLTAFFVLSQNEFDA